VYPEHRDIAVLAVQKLDRAHRVQLHELWNDLRIPNGERLCAKPAEAEQGLTPACIDWAALAAVAGDHACSAEEMSQAVLNADWVLVVADVAAQLKLDLARVEVLPLPEQSEEIEPVADFRRQLESEKARAARINALRTADTRLQRADPEYATRAGSNNAHFLAARPSTETTPGEYARLTLNIGAEISALGVYGWYHLSALQKATRLANVELAPETRRELIRGMLFDEAFALHFLQDVFAAGHVAGTWGDASQRKGTHDHYNQAGLEVFLWQGSSDSVVLMGDAHMRPADADRAAASARLSLQQLLDVAAGRTGGKGMPHTPAATPGPDAFDVCRNDRMIERPPALAPTAEAIDMAFDVLRPTPVPGLAAGLGALPRFRSEVGAFVGLAGSMDVRGIDGGFATSNGAGAIGGVDLSFRMGLGLDGVMGEAGDGLVFLSLGIRGDTSSSNSLSSTPEIEALGNITSAVPGRTGISARVRMPFYLVPGDLLLLSPLYLLWPDKYADMAITASNGGLIPWQAGWATPIGRFQFVLGRELGVTFYGLIGDDRVVAPSAAPGGAPRVVDFKSTFLDLPILEYRPYRAFSSNQSSSLIFQLFAGADIPHSERVVSPAGAAPVDLDVVWSLGLRLVFDWRYYP